MHVDPEDDDEWIDAALDVWVSIAPSYVQHDVQPLLGVLRDYRHRGMTLQQFDEALRIAFTQPGVTKRGAINYAYGIVRRWLEEAPARPEQ